MSITSTSAPSGADHTARILISCPDGPGIVAAVTSFLFDRGANIVASDQYSTHPAHGTLFMRVAFFLTSIRASEDRAEFERSFGELAERFEMDWRIAYPDETKRVALLASREGHCLLDLLWRHRQGELEMDVACVISNHEDLRGEVEMLGIPYHHVPVTKNTKPGAEQAMLDILRVTDPAHPVDVVVLARYMQIITGDFLARVGCPVINIHHSFLPAFAGADPYRRAYDRGVKLIGATAHYVTEELDAGPIVDQDVVRVGHGYTVEDLVSVGRDIERTVLARALRSHLDDRVLLHGARTVVF
jgi:formyltetrahydrofolate deformylase